MRALALLLIAPTCRGGLEQQRAAQGGGVGARPPPAVGAIRWDAYFSQPGEAVFDDPNAGIVTRTTTFDMSPKEWHYRVPFFGAEVLKVTVFFDVLLTEPLALEDDLDLHHLLLSEIRREGQAIGLLSRENSDGLVVDQDNERTREYAEGDDDLQEGEADASENHRISGPSSGIQSRLSSGSMTSSVMEISPEMGITSMVHPSSGSSSSAMRTTVCSAVPSGNT